MSLSKPLDFYLTFQRPWLLIIFWCKLMPVYVKYMIEYIISTLKHQYQFPLDISPSESVCPSRSYPLTFLLFTGPRVMLKTLSKIMIKMTTSMSLMKMMMINPTKVKRFLAGNILFLTMKGTESESKNILSVVRRAGRTGGQLQVQYALTFGGQCCRANRKKYLTVSIFLSKTLCFVGSAIQFYKQ